ncbi:MAG: hypothetical protein GY842_11300 [bacterium]|nr:hypothetical protein [bacterium]
MSRSRGKSSRRSRRSPAVRVEADSVAGDAAAAKAWIGGGGSRLLDWGAHILVPVGLFLLVWAWHPFHDVFEFDPDEGNNVIKALMLAKGHALYSEIWNDQPPLFSHMLRWWYGLAGWTVHQGRLLVLGCSAVLAWALYQIVRRSWGHVAALAGVVLLATSYRYLALSAAVMLALPTLMFAMLSFWFLAWYRDHSHPVWLALSGALLAVSLFTKLLALLFAPLIFVAMVGAVWFGRERGEGQARRIGLVAVWCGGFVLTAGVVLLATVPLSELSLLVTPHLDAKEKLSSPGYDRVFTDMVKADYAVGLLGLAGLAQILRRRAWWSLVPVAWALLAYASLYAHRPLWYHHYPLLAIPLCWTAGIGVGALFTRESWKAVLPWRGMRSAAAGGMLVVALVAGTLAAARLPGKMEREYTYAERYTRMAANDKYITAVLRQFKDRTDYIVTDRQILAFSAGLIVPPELSVTSVKRMRSGHLSMDRLVELLEEYDPGVVHLSWRKRIPLKPKLNDFLTARYERLYLDPRGDRCYVRRDLADDAVVVLERARDEVPNSSEGHYNLGVRLASVGRYQEAARSLDSSLTLEPTLDGYRVLAPVLARLGHAERAADAYERVARVWQRRGRQEEASRALEQARRLRQE